MVLCTYVGTGIVTHFHLFLLDGFAGFHLSVLLDWCFSFVSCLADTVVSHLFTCFFYAPVGFHLFVGWVINEFHLFYSVDTVLHLFYLFLLYCFMVVYITVLLVFVCVLLDWCFSFVSCLVDTVVSHPFTCFCFMCLLVFIYLWIRWLMNFICSLCFMDYVVLHLFYFFLRHCFMVGRYSTVAAQKN